MLLTLIGCGAGHGGWDVRAAEQRYPAIAQQRGHRLGDLSPHFWIAGDELLLFHCGWPLDRPVRVEVAGASPSESELVDRALAALAGAVHGLDFERSDSLGAGPGIRLSIVDVPEPEAGDRGIPPSGEATVDCRVDEPFGAARGEGSLRAQLERASVWVLRSRYDWLGRVVPLTELELLAVVLHELGHAVGFPSHAEGGATLMRAVPWEVTVQVRPVLRGEPLRDPTLAALYHLPSGSVLGRMPAGAAAAATARVFGDLSRRQGWGPIRSRAGQNTAEVWWDGAAAGRRVLSARRTLQPWPAGFVLRANGAARAVLREASSGSSEVVAPTPPLEGEASIRGGH